MDCKIVRWNLFVGVAGLSVLLAWGVVASPAHALKEKLPPPDHFRVAIDPKAALKDLLPTPPKNALPGGASIVDDLARVPEVQLHEPLIIPRFPMEEGEKSATAEKIAQHRQEHVSGIAKAIVHTARLTAHINFVNKTKTDRFMDLLIENRPDLAGMPFAMGDACRLKAGERKQFKNAVELVQATRLFIRPAESAKRASADWQGYDDMRQHKAFRSLEDRFCAAACMQMLALGSPEVRLGMVERLAAFDETDQDRKAATHALTKLAIFSQEAEVRRAAIEALKKRDQGADHALLLHGLRYPWPSMAQNAATLASKLRRKELIPELIKMLDEPDPRAPALQEVKGKKTPVLREVVKINHHRNCLLCHPPGNTPDVMTIVPFEKSNKKEVEKGVAKMYCDITKQADDVLVGAVPTPGLPLPSGSDGYSQQFSSPDILVRADITYLRQDFSLLQKVPDAAPWPEMQRFDYLVRSRALTEVQAAAYQAEFAKLSTPSPYRQAALAALRGLTGLDAGTSAAAWREALGMK